MARRKLGDTLVGWGVITPQQLEAALEAQARDGRTVRRRIGRVLVDAGMVTDGAVAAALADMHGLQVVDLELQIIDPGVAQRIPHSIAVQHVVLPLTVREGVLRVAVADPVDVVALDDLRMRAQGLRLEVVVAAETQLRDKIAELWSQVVTEDALEKFVSELSVDEEVNLEAGDDEGAVAAVQQILSAAVRAGASDVHIEPMRDGVRVRVRIDGTLRPLMSLPRSGHSSIVARTKIVAGLDIVERRVPQDGRARLRVTARPQPARVHAAHDARGEDRGAAAVRSGVTAEPHRSRDRPGPGVDPAERPAPAAGARADHGPDRLGKVDHPVRGDPADDQRRAQPDHPRGSGRDRTARRGPGTGLRQDRNDVGPDCAQRCARTRT